MDKNNRAPIFKGSEFIRLASSGSKDILTVLLEPNKTYTEDEVKKLVDNYLNKEVGK